MIKSWRKKTLFWIGLLTFHTLPVAILVLFCKKELSIIPAHLLISAYINSILFLFFDVFVARFSRFIQTLYLGTYCLLNLFFYSCVLGGNFLWGQTVRMDLVIQHIPLLPTLLNNLFLPSTSIFLAFFALLGGIFFCVYRFLPPKFHFLLAFSSLKQFNTRKILYLGAGIIAALLLALPAKRWAHRNEEPLIVSILGDEGSNSIVNEVRLAQGVQDQKIRAQYAIPDSFQAKNVIIITADAMRFDHLQMYGYQRETAPFLHELYGQGKLLKVRNARSTCACSECGVSSTLFGKNWNKVGYNGFTLVSALKKAGYDTHFILSGYSRLWSPTYECFIPDLTQYIENIEYPLADDSCILAGLKRIPANPQVPQFIYLHLMSTHLAGIKYPRFAHYLPNTATGLSLESSPEAFKNVHDNGILQADAFIREIFSQLEAKNILQNAVVVILSDHGEGMGEHNLYRHTSFLYETVNRIPLLIYDNAPNVYKNTSFVRQIDIAPTLLHRLGLPVPSSWQGTSMLNDTVATYSFHQSVLKNADRFSLIEYQDSVAYKFMFNHDFTWKELYEIIHDSSEQHNLIAQPAYQNVYRRLEEKAKKEFPLQYEY
ncbi:MAG: sulfatase-like hydrolase/transferase [Bacteroidia bacterium]